MSESLRDAMAEALLFDPDIAVRTNKASRLPFEVVDRSGPEPIVLSAWADDAEAHSQRRWAIACRRRNAALAAIEAAGYELVRKCPKGWAAACSRNGGPYCCSTCIGDWHEERRQHALAQRPKP